MDRVQLASRFLMLAAHGNVKEAFENYVSADFVHHNQYFEGTREALQNAMSDAHMQTPNESFEIKFSYEDKNTVITHSLVKQEKMEIAVVHIFRFEKDRIVELWDLGQPIEKNSPNKNGLF